MEERRRVQRIRVLKAAQVIFIGRSMALDCVVHDLTSRGVCLHGPRINELPPNFQLTFDRGRTRRACKLMWSHEGRVGAAFENVGDGPL